LLVLGESHYLPKLSTIHLNPRDWYSATECQLTDKERDWISTAKIIAESKKKGFRIKAHWIYKNIAREVSAAGGGENDFIEAIEDVAFYNYFQRPAIYGASLRVDPRDREVAEQVFHWVVSELKPELLIFTSRKAGWECAQFLRECDIPSRNTPHPTCRWWNKASRAYGGVTGRTFFRDFLIEQTWHNQASDATSEPAPGAASSSHQG
jgi:hypothetical protein